MDINRCTIEMEQFRDTLYQNLNNRADTLMELVDAISSNSDAKSVVEFSLTSCFRRSYSALFKAIDEMELPKMMLPYLVAPNLSRPRQRAFWLLMTDVTPQPRPYAQTLADRGMVYQPEVIKGKLPVTIGHQYSTVAVGPEPEAQISPSWVVPLLTRRVATDEDKEMVGARQISELLQDRKLPFGRMLCVEVGDSSYSKPAYLHAHRKHRNLVTIVRVRSNRTFYHQPLPAADDVVGPGHPIWYGKAFSLSKPESWRAPDEQVTRWETSRRGKRYRIEVQAWQNMLMRGKQKPEPLPMHLYPFTLICITRFDEQGNLACQRPMWLLVMGDRRDEVRLHQSVKAYKQRFDMEHFYRFGKQKLRLADFQTPEVEREESWWQLVHIAYAQLWMARQLTHLLPRPWERNLPAVKRKLISPTLVQRDFGRIIRQLGTPAQSPKRRGFSAGRRPGLKLPPRKRQKVVVKSQQNTKPP
jgi:hypothetical protein